MVFPSLSRRVVSSPSQAIPVAARTSVGSTRTIRTQLRVPGISRTINTGRSKSLALAVVNGNWLFGDSGQNDGKEHGSVSNTSTKSKNNSIKSSAKQSALKSSQERMQAKASNEDAVSIQHGSVLEMELQDQVQQMEQELAQEIMQRKALEQQLEVAQEQAKRTEASLQENFSIVLEARNLSRELLRARKELDSEAERVGEIALGAEEMHRSAKNQMAEATVKLSQAKEKVELAETKAETMMSDAKKLVDMERSTAAAIESSAAQKVIVTEQAAKALIDSTKAVYSKYSDEFDKANEHRISILAKALKKQEVRLTEVANNAAMRLSAQERLFASMEEATAKRVEGWEMEVGLRLQTAEMDAEDQVVRARQEADKEIEQVRQEMMAQANELQKALEKQLASVNKAHCEQLRILRESYERRLESERETCRKMITDASKRASEMELAAQHMITEAERESTERIMEMKTSFAEEYESLETQLQAQTEHNMQLQEQLLQQRKEHQQAISAHRDEMLNEQEGLISRMEEKLKSCDKLHAQEMQNLRDVKVKELQAAKSQVAQAQKSFVKELKLEISEREQAHAEQIKLIKERYEEALEKEQRKSHGYPARIQELEAAVALAEKSRIVEIERVRLECANKVADMESQLEEEREVCEVEVGQSQRYTAALRRALSKLEQEANGPKPDTTSLEGLQKLPVAEEQVGPFTMPRQGRIFAVFRNGVEVEKIITTGPKQMYEMTARKTEEMMDVHEELKQKRLESPELDGATTMHGETWPDGWSYSHAHTKESIPQHTKSNSDLSIPKTSTGAKQNGNANFIDKNKPN